MPRWVYDTIASALNLNMLSFKSEILHFGPKKILLKQGSSDLYSK